MKKKLIVCLAAVLAVGTLLAGCGSADSSNSGSAGGSAVEAEPVSADHDELIAGTSAGYFGATNLDVASEWNGWYLSFFGVSENLFRLDDAYNAVPWLVDTYSNVDDTTWEFTLRDDVTFTNGEKMTAESVKACLERTYQVSDRAASTLAIDEIRADGQVLTIVTPAANPTILNDLCDPLFGIYYVGDDQDYEGGSVCTGPYVVKEFVANEVTTLSAYPEYWGGAPKEETVVLKSFTDVDTMVYAIQNGEIDIIAALPAASVSLFSDESAYTTYSVPTTRGHFIRFNYDSPIASDPAVRQALAMCIDREGYAAELCEGTCVPDWGVFTNTLSYGNTDNLNLTVDKYDPEGAAKVLADAGWEDTDGDGILDKDGTPLKIKCITISTQQSFLDMGDILHSTLGSIGIDFTQTSYEQLETQEAYADLDWDMEISSKAMAPTGNPQYFLNTDIVTDGPANYGGYSNAQIDELTTKLSTTFEPAERDAIMYEVQQIILDESAYIVFSNPEFICVSNNDVTGFEIQPSEYYFIDNQIEKN